MAQCKDHIMVSRRRCWRWRRDFATDSGSSRSRDTNLSPVFLFLDGYFELKAVFVGRKLRRRACGGLIANRGRAVERYKTLSAICSRNFGHKVAGQLPGFSWRNQRADFRPTSNGYSPVQKSFFFVCIVVGFLHPPEKRQPGDIPTCLPSCHNGSELVDGCQISSSWTESVKLKYETQVLSIRLCWCFH